MVKKLVVFVVILLVVIGGGTYLTPWTAQYEVKTAAKIACAENIKLMKGYGDPKWFELFERKATAAGVKLGKGQYAFKVEDRRGENVYRCQYKVAWRSSTPWVGLDVLWPDAPPLTLVHRLDSHFDIPRTF